jgi:hypothetical protein
MPPEVPHRHCETRLDRDHVVAHLTRLQLLQGHRIGYFVRTGGGIGILGVAGSPFFTVAGGATAIQRGVTHFGGGGT